MLTEPQTSSLFVLKFVATLSQLRFVIETRVNQKTSDAHFQKAFDPLEEKLKQAKPSLGFSVAVWIPHGGLQTGQNWKDIAQALERYISSSAISLDFGRHWPQIAGVPFQIVVDKSKVAPDGSTHCGLGRYSAGLGGHDECKQIIRVALQNKSQPMAKYKLPDCSTTLLFETQDFTTMAPDVFVRCFDDVFDPASSIFDQVWLAWIVAGQIYGPYCLYSKLNPERKFNINRDMF